MSYVKNKDNNTQSVSLLNHHTAFCWLCTKLYLEVIYVLVYKLYLYGGIL